ncbi:radical SAM protein [Gallaecimonas xiamenensis]|uniref:Radical SAM domain-containing protein n=1 Tax=Gallaecimonas xiamenensis 3-C-1 TaxID=745411 RepID=K2KKD1_9GAMM|nr:radical SAM protein [Gallaecimonas xiamenensis]EKE77850.1 radical SAM domain-containing protein [Gallaecimonas xiamenensis 3-C-1]
MFNLPYIQPVFRPPSEWQSLILQVTNGCSYNQCTFCDMYTAPQKKFRARKLEELEAEIKAVAATGVSVTKVFLADGDAMTLPMRRLEAICRLIREHLPGVRRISSYCLPRNLKNKSVEELRLLAELGLTLVYVGCESGDDEVLAGINKGETFESSKAALLKLGQAGIKRSVMILNGMGGKERSQQHALNSARLMNATQPEYLSTLVVSFPLGMDRVVAGFDGRFTPLAVEDLIAEQGWLLGELDLNSTIFRSDHASNYLVLKGTLGRDKAALLAQIASARDGLVPLRAEWQRGL